MERFLLDPKNQRVQEGKGRRLRLEPFVALLFMVPFIAAGVMLLVVAGDEWRRNVRFESGIVTQGIVTKLWVDERDDSPTYNVEYCYALAPSSDFTHRGEDWVEKETYDRLKEGSRLPVRYLKDAVEQSRVVNRVSQSGPLVMFLFGLFWNGFIGFATWHIIKTIARSWKFLRARLVPGEVTDASGVHDSDDDYQVTVSYRFISPDSGQPLLGRSTCKRDDIFGQALPKPGRAVTIQYVNDTTHEVL